MITALILGIIAGIFTGIVPGIHINLVAGVLIGISAWITASPLSIGTFIFSMGITHTFLDSLPSVFLGAPNDDTVLAVLPAHKYVLRGRGREAILLMTIGSLLCLIIAVIALPLLVKAFPFLYKSLSPSFPVLIPLIILFLIFREVSWRRLWGFAVFISSGIFGLIVLDTTINQPLFPMLTGLFGMSGLLLSLKQSIIPSQSKANYAFIERKEIMKAVGTGIIGGSAITLFPGMSPAHAALLVNSIAKLKDAGYLVLVGGINGVDFLASLVTLVTLSRARNGALEALSTFLKVNTTEMIYFAGIALFAGGIATILTLIFSRVFALMMNKVNYFAVSIGVISFIIVLCAVVSGFQGLIVMAVGTAIGMIAPLTGCSRSHAMGCLLVPVLTYLW